MLQTKPRRQLPNIKRQIPSLLTQFIDVFLIELTNWRWSWRSLLMLGTISPLLSLTALGIFARDSGPYALSYVLIGNVVLALLFNNMDNVQMHVLYMRQHGTLDYFTTLPVRRFIIVLALLAAFLLLSLPSLMVTIVAGSLILGITLHPSPLLIVIIPGCAIPFSVLGAFIGSRMSTPQAAGSLSYLITLVLLSIGSVIIPPDHLPPPLVSIGRLNPATYAASALRQGLLGPATGQLPIDIGVLLGLSVIAFWLVNHKLDWNR